MGISVVMPYTAYLRVYEPLAAFPEPERSRWAAYAGGQDMAAWHPGAVLVAEQRAAMAGLLATPPLAAPEQESLDAFVLVAAGETYVCPWQMRLRCWLALEDLVDGFPPEVVATFFAPEIVDRAAADFARWRAANTAVVPRILTSTWHVPLWWFVAFATEERRLVLDGTHRSMVYRASMADARRRVARAVRVLARSVEEGPATAGVANLGRWLEEWHPHGLVELDYGGLVRLLDDEELRGDTSVADAAEGLAALAREEVDQAVESYQRLVQRWRDVQALEHAN